MPSDVTAAGLDALEGELVGMLMPLPAPAILAEIEALRNHFGEWADRSPGQAKRLHRDWLEDLADAPGAFLIEACKRWRRAYDPPNRRPPHTAGELLAGVSDDLAQVRFLAHQIARARTELARLAAPESVRVLRRQRAG